jgi:EmrB/QacA subfamily drug resistance transporter
MTDSERQPAARTHSPWLVLFTLCLGFFMILLDTTIVNIAIPGMSASLDASLDEILWVLNAYVLVFAVLLVTGGRLGDLYGPRLLFVIGLAIFTLASVACGFAQNPQQLIAGRVIQGIGGALLTPQSLTVITVIFPPDKRGAAFGIWGSTAGLATIAGPTLGGYLVTYFGWEWIFFVNLPVGVAAIVLALMVMPELSLNRRHRLDVTGTLLVTAGLFLVVYGLIEGESHDWGRVWGPVTIPEVIAAGVLVLAGFMVHQSRTRGREPLVPFEIFADRNFSLMNYVSASIAFGMLGLFLPLVIFLQSVIGLTALQAGLALAPMSAISMLVAPFTGRLVDRTGGKWILVCGLSLWVIGMALVVWLADVDSGQWSLLPGVLVAGLGLGLTFAPLQTIAMHNVQPRMAGAASGMINTVRQLGAVIGSAAVGAVLQVQLVEHLRESARQHASALPPQFRDEFVTRFGASGGSLHVGAGQSAVNLPADLPEQARQTISAVARQTFAEGFTGAMKAALILPLVVLAVAAVACLFVKQEPRQSGQPAAGHPDAEAPDGRTPAAVAGPEERPVPTDAPTR